LEDFERMIFYADLLIRKNNTHTMPKCKLSTAGCGVHRGQVVSLVLHELAIEKQT